MKKKKVILSGIMAVTIAGAAVGGSSLTASATNSRGNFILESGEVAVYASDIDYLQSEIDALFREIPRLSNDFDTENVNAEQED